MKQLTIDEVHKLKIRELGLDPTKTDLTSTEAIACSLRRVASFLCPCAASSLIRGVVRPLQGLVSDLTGIKEHVESILERIVSHGDLIEQNDILEGSEKGRSLLLYAAPPSFLSLQSGKVILLGITSGQISFLPDDLEARIEYSAHIRRLISSMGEDLPAQLVELGFIELSFNVWQRKPTVESSKEHLSRLNNLLDSSAPSGDLPGLVLLDPTLPVRYYRGRWIEPKNETGRFVGRRKQAYGADIWCYVEVIEGNPIKFVDFPQKNSFFRGCDEAWRLQAAIDNERNMPQVFRVHDGPRGTQVIDFFSPIPMWASRRFEAIGETFDSLGCLFSYKFRKEEIQNEIAFLKNELWLAEIA